MLPTRARYPPETSIQPSNVRRVAVAIAIATAVSAAAFARTSLDALFTQTPSEMKFVADPAHAGYETAVLVGDPAGPGIYAVHTKLPANIKIVPHTHSEKWRIATVLSGTLYVSAPPGSGALRLEDPRLPMMMAAPPRSDSAPEDSRNFIYVEPEPGLVLLWESWLRHEVTAGRGKADRLSVSFNFS